MLPVLSGLLFALWFLFVYLLFAKEKGSGFWQRSKMKIKFPQSFNLEGYQEEANSIGWKVSQQELMVILIVVGAITLAASVIINNPFIIVAGLFIGFYLPRFLLKKKRHSLRLSLISKLTDPLRMLISRIPDQQNVTRAIEVTRNETGEEAIRKLFDGYLQDVGLGCSVRDALINMGRKVNLRKFDTFIDNLIQAHYDGFTREAIKALDKAVEAIEFDLRAIEKVKEQSTRNKKKLYSTLAVSWMFPPLLSMVSTTTGKNIYLDTLLGKILIFSYVVVSIYVYVRGEEYLSLNLDEL